MDNYEKLRDFANTKIDADSITEQRKEKLRNDAEWFIEVCEDEKYNSWDSGTNNASETFEDIFYSQYAKWTDEGQVNKYYEQLACIIKASLDVAFADFNGGGVLGYDLGYIKRMYQNNIPKWVTETLELTPDMPDDLGIWL